jgi:hypothetical protein
MIIRRSLVLAAFATLVIASGCSGKREHAEEGRQMRTGEAPRGPLPAPSEPARGDSTAELFSRVHDHESRLSQTITANRLDEVGQEAFLIRDLIVTAARQANVPVDQKAALEEHVSTVRRMAAALSRVGKAGNLNEAKAGNAELQRELGLIERMIGLPQGASPDTE